MQSQPHVYQWTSQRFFSLGRQKETASEDICTELWKSCLPLAIVPVSNAAAASFIGKVQSTEQSSCWEVRLWLMDSICWGWVPTIVHLRAHKPVHRAVASSHPERPRFTACDLWCLWACDATAPGSLTCDGSHRYTTLVRPRRMMYPDSRCGSMMWKLWKRTAVIHHDDSSVKGTKPWVENSSLWIQEAAKRQERREQEAAARQAPVSVFLCHHIAAALIQLMNRDSSPF